MNTETPMTPFGKQFRDWFDAVIAALKESREEETSFILLSASDEPGITHVRGIFTANANDGRPSAHQIRLMLSNLCRSCVAHDNFSRAERECFRAAMLELCRLPDDPMKTLKFPKFSGN